MLFLACVLLSAAAMSLPDRVRDPVARTLRQTVLAPLLALQQQSELLSASLTRYQGMVAERDSTALAATFLPELRNENTRLRALLGLGQRLGSGYVAAEVLHQSLPTDPLTLIVGAGRKQGVRPLAAVVSPEGLVGLVSAVDERTSVVVTWAHPEFRASAMAADGSVYGIVAAHGSDGPRGWLLELRGVPYRQLVPEGTLILTSGLGGVFGRGIPLGTVVTVVEKAEGWEQTYLLRPAVHPAAVSHVMILIGNRASLAEAFDTAAVKR
ncbi:MAG TPA: rod shape-determining protein MreC [Gemmatimonadales bacterium]|nr:rod shape-determining protein MreC [Gemmatimonadales bacterium]